MVWQKAKPMPVPLFVPAVKNGSKMWGKFFRADSSSSILEVNLVLIRIQPDMNFSLSCLLNKIDGIPEQIKQDMYHENLIAVENKITLFIPDDFRFETLENIFLQSFIDAGFSRTSRHLECPLLCSVRLISSMSITRFT